MHSQLLIAALAASASASANLFPAHMAIRRDLLVARQTDSAGEASATSGGLSDTECQATLLAIATDLPVPDGDLLAWEVGQAGTDPCAVTGVPSSLSSQYTSYTDAVLSWYAESSSELLAAVSACPQYAADVSAAAVCTESAAAGATTAAEGGSDAPAATGSSSTATGTATESGSSDPTGTASGSASSSSVETAGAALREAGIVGAVLAGVLGVAVAL